MQLPFNSNFRELSDLASASGGSALSPGPGVSVIQNEKQRSLHRKYDEEIIGASEAVFRAFGVVAAVTLAGVALRRLAPSP